MSYVMLPDTSAVAVALWCIHAHAFEASYISPRLAITSPEKRCGKTTLLRVMQALVPKPLSASNITAAALFRTVEAVRPSLLIDEADSFLDENEELRGIINSGHARDGQVIRLVGEDHEPRAFSTWCPTAIAAARERRGGAEGGVQKMSQQLTERTQISFTQQEISLLAMLIIKELNALAKKLMDADDFDYAIMVGLRDMLAVILSRLLD
jgi:hypothetical protein